METSSKVLLWTISLSVVVAIFSTAYLFLLQKNFTFALEAPCDSVSETNCFYRDCSTGECPPNELEYYRVLLVSARDFTNCSDNSCVQECTSGKIVCEEIICDPKNGDECRSGEIMYQPSLDYYEDENTAELTPTYTAEFLTENNTESEQNATSTLETTF